MSWLFWPIPRRVTVLIADAIGLFLFHVLRLRRNVVEQNLEIAFGKTKSLAERRRIARRTYQNGVLSIIEFLQPEPLFGAQHHVVASHGYEHFEKVRQQGAIILTAHLGNWETMPAYAKQQGVELTTLIKPLHNPLINDNVVRTRCRDGMQVLSITSSMKPLVSAVRRGRWLVFLSDQDARRHGIFVDFFGRPASTAPGVAHFALRLGQPILPVFSTRSTGPLRQLEIHFYPPIFPDPNQPREAEIERMTQEHVKTLEHIVSRFPEDYFWFHRRWKTKPKRVKV